MTSPIPIAALDDRLGFVGTAGSGKTYNAMAAVERLMASGARVVIPDPLGVWWGLRLLPDGKTASPYRPVIFGGRHGDLPINEHAGALIGETVAGMAESAIIDLSDFPTKAAERRFMLAFLTALYRHTSSDPLHVIFDEADMWAPERMLDKDGDAAKLKGMMETIVRRGRVKGFIPWLITQRPAVISKDVLSQVDGLVSFKLTSSQDRNALGAWVEGQADKAEWSRLYGELATLPRGTGLVWLPARGVLTQAAFPPKATFDSSRTPKRGEKRSSARLQPLDLGALKERLATIEAEAKDNDPKALKAEIASLRRQLAKADKTAIQVAKADPAEIEKARQDGYADGYSKALLYAGRYMKEGAGYLSKVDGPLGALRLLFADFANNVPDPQPPARVAQRIEFRASNPKVGGSNPPARSNPPADGLNGPQQKILNALGWWRTVGQDMPTRVQVAVVAGYSPTGGAFQNPLGALRTAGLVDYPEPGVVALTADGEAIAESPGTPPSVADLHARVMAILDGPRRRILQPLLDAYPRALSRDELARASGYEPTGGAFQNPLGALRSLGLIDYPERGKVAALPLLFP